MTPRNDTIKLCEFRSRTGSKTVGLLKAYSRMKMTKLDAGYYCSSMVLSRVNIAIVLGRQYGLSSASHAEVMNGARWDRKAREVG